MSFTQSESGALNILRWGSTIAIVVCHILQAYDNDWCWVFNVGVQVFFFISGFIYGCKRITNVRKFYVGRLLKLYIPYVVWVTFAIVLLLLFTESQLSVRAIVGQYCMRSHLPGLNHLWFMYVIFICYVLLPLVDWLVSRYSIVAIPAIIILGVAVIMLRGTAYSVWCALYYVGFFCGRFTRIHIPVLVVSIIAACCIIVNQGLGFDLFKQYTLLGHVFHALLGIIISLSVYLTVRNTELHPRISHLLTNGGGYEIYLVHHLFILGPLSLVFITNNKLINIAIIIAITIVCSIALMHVGRILTDKIQLLKIYKTSNS